MTNHMDNIADVEAEDVDEDKPDSVAHELVRAEQRGKAVSIPPHVATEYFAKKSRN